MADDQLLRRALLTGIALIFSVAVYHRLKAHATGEPLDRRQEGWFILATLRPAGLVTILGVITYFVSPVRIAWASLPLPLWLRWSGIALLALDVALLGWTLHTLGKN